MKRIAVFTSGGDSPGMNACIRAVVRTAISHKMQVIGIRNGYEGMIDGDFITMNSRMVSGIIQQGGTILNSSRSKRFWTKRGRNKAYQRLKKEGIEGVVAIGGDGTFAGAKVFMNEHNDIAIVGTPGTIDNDLNGTDFTIGYDTAINTAMCAIDNIKDTANAHHRLFFVEVMGKDAGLIALRTAIATGAEAVLIPETKTDIDALVKELKANYKKKKTSSIVIVAEGDDEGGAYEIAKKVKARFDKFEQKVTILGHIQRGGRPTCMERVRASRMGLEAVISLKNGKEGIMIGLIHDTVVYTPFENAVKYQEEINPTLLNMVKILS